jgi:hypothetical protein
MSIEDLIDNITGQEYAKAEPMFHELLQSKVNDALEAEKVKVAGQIFNGEEEQLEMDFDDDELETEDDSEEEFEDSEEEIEEEE